MQITKIGEKNKSKRLSIYLDDNFVCFLNEFTVFKHKLFVGKEIDLKTLEEFQFESEKDDAFNLAIKYLSKYTKTEKELKDYLLKKGYLPYLVENVLEKLKEYRYINDKFFVESYVKANLSRYGKNKILQSLKQKGVDEQILNELEFETDYESLQNLAQKYLKNKEKTYQNMQKCSKFLYSRGFDFDEISKVLSLIKEDKNESWE